MSGYGYARGGVSVVVAEQRIIKRVVALAESKAALAPYYAGGYTRVPKWISALRPTLGPQCYSVLMAIVDRTLGWHKTTDAISYSQLAQDTGLSMSSVRRSVEGLIVSGLITVTKQHGASNRYRINHSPRDTSAKS